MNNFYFLLFFCSFAKKCHINLIQCDPRNGIIKIWSDYTGNSIGIYVQLLENGHSHVFRSFSAIEWNDNIGIIKVDPKTILKFGSSQYELRLVSILNNVVFVFCQRYIDTFRRLLTIDELVSLKNIIKRQLFNEGYLKCKLLTCPTYKIDLMVSDKGSDFKSVENFSFDLDYINDYIVSDKYNLRDNIFHHHSNYLIQKYNIKYELINV